MEVINELLGYPCLKIVQDYEMFNFSIDSMLLGYFASIGKRVNKICDLCSGNSPIPLYLTLRTKKPIVGVEIQKKAFQLGVKSVMINNKEEQITLVNDDLIGIHKKIGYQAFELVTVNPPFFKVSDKSITNKNDALTIARHEVLVTLDEIVNEANQLLNNGGYLAMVHRPDRLLDVIEAFRKYHIEPKRLQFVYPRKNTECNHILIEGIKGGAKGGLKILEPLYIYDGEKWTPEILKIYNLKEEL